MMAAAAALPSAAALTIDDGPLAPTQGAQLADAPRDRWEITLESELRSNPSPTIPRSPKRHLTVEPAAVGSPQADVIKREPCGGVVKPKVGRQTHRAVLCHQDAAVERFQFPDLERFHRA